MKGTFLGFDPDLGRKFAQEQTGSVIARVKPSQKELQRSRREMPPGLDAQQQHDWENGMMEDLPLSQQLDPQSDEALDSRAESLRRLRVRRMLKAQPGRTSDSSK